MKISLKMIKDVLKSARGIDRTKFNSGNIMDIIEELDDSTVNDICASITGIKKEYTEDIFEEDGALEVISDFLLSTIDKLSKSKSLRAILKKTLGIDTEVMMNLLEKKNN